MKIENIILTYIAVQSLTTAMGLFFIYSTQARVNEEILKRNYKLAEKNSLYKFNEKLTDFFKVFIPFYYFVKGLNIIKDSGDFSKTVAKAIASGKYEPLNFEKPKVEKEIPVAVPQPKIEFEITKEKFKAIKNRDNIYNPDETPIEYIEKVMNNENTIELSPYYEKTIDDIAPIQQIDINSELSYSDVISYISNLTPLELEELSESIEQMKLVKQVSYSRTHQKDIA